VRGRLTDPAFLAAAAAPAAAAGLALLFIVPTVAPSVASWDTAEFQTVGPVLGTAHPTGYPSYVILGWLASIVLQPFGDPAYRMNLLQAILAAAAVAGTVALVQVLTGRRFIALATGLMLACSQLFWRLSTHADAHMFHIALTAVLFLVLLIWDRRCHSEDPDTVRHADRWLVAAAFIYGVAVANHSLALLLPPAIGLFVLMADRRVIFRRRTIVACVAVLAATIAAFFLELPIRAAMHAPLVYGHPDTLSGFQYVVLAEQFRGSLYDPFGDLPTKAGQVVDLITGWLGPLGMLAAVGFGTSLVRRPRYIVLSGVAAVVTCGFAASYANADIERYYLLPLLVAFTWAGLGAADLVTLAGWAASEMWARVAVVTPEPLEEPDLAPADSAELGPAPSAVAADSTRGTRRVRDSWAGPTALASQVAIVVEVVIAVAIAFSSVSVVPERQLPGGSAAGAVSEAQNTHDAVWMRAVLAPANQGGLPKDSVIVSWWSASTTLWYGQRVLGLRPDIYIVDDRTRLDDNLGEVQDVFNRFLGNRPVFTIRMDGGIDGMVALGTEYNMRPYALRNGDTIMQVIDRKGSQ
jgi:hypothetical protein